MRSWLGCKDRDVLKLIANIFEKMISFANTDYRKEGVTCHSTGRQASPARSNSLHKQEKVLSNITNTINNQAVIGPKFIRMKPKAKERSLDKHPLPLSTNASLVAQPFECCYQGLYSTQLFKKIDIVNMVNSRVLSEFVGAYCRVLAKQQEMTGRFYKEEKLAIEALIETVIEIVLDFKDREMYDALSMRFIKADAFHALIKVIVASPLLECEYRSVARIFELCACHQEGISILQRYLQQVIELVDTFMAPQNDLIQIKYPAATVLLDLTANE